MSRIDLDAIIASVTGETPALTASDYAILAKVGTRQSDNHRDGNRMNRWEPAPKSAERVYVALVRRGLLEDWRPNGDVHFGITDAGWEALVAYRGWRAFRRDPEGAYVLTAPDESVLVTLQPVTGGGWGLPDGRVAGTLKVARDSFLDAG